MVPWESCGSIPPPLRERCFSCSAALPGTRSSAVSVKRNEILSAELLFFLSAKPPPLQTPDTRQIKIAILNFWLCEFIIMQIYVNSDRQGHTKRNPYDNRRWKCKRRRRENDRRHSSRRVSSNPRANSVGRRRSRARRPRVEPPRQAAISCGR